MSILSRVISVCERKSDLVNRVYRNLSFGLVVFAAPILLLPMFLGYYALRSISILGGIASFAIPIFFRFRINSISARAATIMFYSYAVALGCALSLLTLIYSGNLLVMAIGMTSISFLVSLYIAKNVQIRSADVRLIMTGLVALLIMSLVNVVLRMFFGISFTLMQLIISVLGMVVMTGLSAYQISELEQNNALVAVDQEKAAIVIALSLLLNIVNFFLYALQFLRITSSDNKR